MSPLTNQLRPRNKLGLIMGAGGAFGWAYHLGVLEGLYEATGQRIHDATRVIGTSAGAAISAATLTGRSLEDILATTLAGADEEMMDDVKEAMANARKPWRWLKPQAPRLVVRAALRSPMVATVGLLPAGLFPTAPLRRFVDSDTVDWPSNLWIPTVRLDTGKVVVLGRDRTDVGLRDAIEATAAVPMMLRPKQIDGLHFIDGAVSSATHGHLLDDISFDRVVISSPMTRPGRGPVKIRARRQLTAEVAALRAKGTHVVVVEPTTELMDLAAGYPRKNHGAGPAVVAAAKQLTMRAFEQAA